MDVIIIHAFVLPKGLYSLDIFGEQYKIKVMQRCPENQTFTHVWNKVGKPKILRRSP